MVARVRFETEKKKPTNNVGYGKPPKATQFKPGQSGNPKGRPKGVSNFSTDVLNALHTPVRVEKAGRVRHETSQMAMLMVLREKALKGDPKALQQYLNLAVQFNTAEPVALSQKLAPKDEEILAAYVRGLDRESGNE
jgi:Family of unknown function (DUF5681)